MKGIAIAASVVAAAGVLSFPGTESAMKRAGAMK
jgi:hypothetical protein